MTARQPFQRLLTALAIASGTAAYGATAQPSPLQPVDSFQTPGSIRTAILSSAPADSATVQLIAQKRGSDSSSRGDSGGRGNDGGRGSNGGGGGISAKSFSGGDSGGRSSSPRIDVSPRRIDTPKMDVSPRRIDTPKMDVSPRRIETPKIDMTPRRIETPRIETPRRIETPKIETPRRIETPKIDTRRIDVPKVETPRRIETPKIDLPKNNLGDNVVPRTTNRGPDFTPRIDNKNNAGGSLNVDGNRLDTNLRNRNQVDVNRRGDTKIDSNNQLDSKLTPRNNNLPNLGNTTGTDNAANRIRDNADRLRDNANKLGNKTTDGTNNAAERIRSNADRLRDNADKLGNKTNIDPNNAVNRIRDKVGNDTDNVLRNADRVDRNKLDPKLKDQLDKARDNRDLSDRVRGNTNRIGDRVGDLTRNRDVLNIKDGVRPIVAGPGKIDADVRSRIEANQRITVRGNNNQSIDLTPFNRPGLGRNFGRDNVVERRAELNGLLHTSRVNRNVSYNGRFNDWHAWNGNNYWRHNNWHRGYWNHNRWNGSYGPNWWGFGFGWGGWGGGWGGWGGGYGGWGGGWGYPLASSFGISPWGMNYVGYGFGLYDYYNPYCYQPVPFYGGYSYDYTQPLIVANNYGSSIPGTAVPNIDQQPAQAEPDMALFDQARTAFHSGNYEESLKLTEQQIQKTPKDSILHEFRGLTLFALGRFEDASIPVYAVLAVGPGWDWATMSSLYSNVDAYASQLKALEDFHRANQDNAAASFLLAYHYLTCGHNEAAAAQLDNVLRINPQDLVATRLLQALGDGSQRKVEDLPMPKDDNSAALPLQVPDVPEIPPAAMVTAEDLYGTWQAQNSKGKTFTLTLTKDGTFEWVSKDDQKTIDQKGVFGVEGESLAMEPDGGGVLVGKVSKPENGSFKLELVGGLPDDKGLEFKRVN